MPEFVIPFFNCYFLDFRGFRDFRVFDLAIFIVRIPHSDSNVLSNIYYASIGSETLRFPRNSSGINTFLTLFSRLLKRMQKQGSKHITIRSVLNKIFRKHFTDFNVFADTLANFIKFSSSPWIRTMHIHIYLLFLACLIIFLFVCLFVCFFVCMVIMLLLFNNFASMYLHLFMFLWVGILYYNFCYYLIFFGNQYLYMI